MSSQRGFTLPCLHGECFLLWLQCDGSPTALPVGVVLGVCETLEQGVWCADTGVWGQD